MLNVGIIGATGYAGAELARLLLSHPEAKIRAMSSVSFEGKPLSSVYPNFSSLLDDTLTTEDDVITKSDVVFASLPHGLSAEIAKKCHDKGALFIDIGADFRLRKESDYKQWYKLDYKYKELNASAVYGLCELYREQIRHARIIGNPGCYPTSVGLGLAPALKEGIAGSEYIVIDSKSGVTGAGRGLSQTTHYPDCNEAFSPYKVATHRHTPEIEQTLSDMAGKEVKITFVPHLLPVNRGIVSTCYLPLKGEFKTDKIIELYKEFYKNDQFVRIRPEGEAVNLKNVKYSNYCDISIFVDPRTERLIVISAIDNMVKGAAGQAIQNMNLATGLPEDTGLHFIPPAF